MVFTNAFKVRIAICIIDFFRWSNYHNITNIKEERQLLPRTDSIRNSEDAKKWLCESCVKLLGESQKSPIFIFHNYIPAISSAFAYASPGDKLVRIEALWGLPEGLYYYSHDKYLVDTKTVDLSKRSRDNFTVHDFRNYKKYFVLPMADGKWEVSFKIKHSRQL